MRIFDFEQVRGLDDSVSSMTAGQRRRAWFRLAFVVAAVAVALVVVVLVFHPPDSLVAVWANVLVSVLLVAGIALARPRFASTALLAALPVLFVASLALAFGTAR